MAINVIWVQLFKGIFNIERILTISQTGWKQFKWKPFSSSRLTPSQTCQKNWITCRWDSFLAWNAKCFKLAEPSSPRPILVATLFSPRTVHSKLAKSIDVLRKPKTRAVMWSQALFSPETVRFKLDRLYDRRPKVAGHDQPLLALIFHQCLLAAQVSWLLELSWHSKTILRAGRVL